MLAQVVLGEKDAQLQRANLHNEMLQEKVQVRAAPGQQQLACG